MFSTTVIPTIGRATLSRAVCSILDQNLGTEDFEVIVVNDSGKPLPSMEWQRDERVQVIHTNGRERSVARNTGAAIARGKFLQFLDDDDWILPGALQAFWELDQDNDAIWLYGSYQTVDNDGNVVDEWYPEICGDIFALLVAGESIPFQTSLLDAEAFHAAGGFDTDPLITGVEDRELGRRLALLGTVAYMPTRAASIRIGEQSSTTNWQTLAASDRLGREKALQQPGTVSRLHESVDSSYLNGRVSRAFLASSVWNLKRRNLLAAASRVTTGLALSGSDLISTDYWRGVRHATFGKNEDWN